MWQRHHQLRVQVLVAALAWVRLLRLQAQLAMSSPATDMRQSYRRRLALPLGLALAPLLLALEQQADPQRPRLGCHQQAQQDRRPLLLSSLSLPSRRLLHQGSAHLRLQQPQLLRRRLQRTAATCMAARPALCNCCLQQSAPSTTISAGTTTLATWSVTVATRVCDWR